MTIKKATVLGAGNMGSQIAALLVNAGLKVQLLDIALDDENPNKLSKAAYDRITDRRKSSLYSLSFAGNLSYGNFDDDLKDAKDSDLFIEAVSEKIEIKHDLWSKVSNIASDTAILTSNTSGIPIADIAEVLTEEQQGRFLGLHFFNPPQYMKLVEIIPHAGTDEKVTQLLSDFTIKTLGKGVVEAKDVNAFVGNRIGVYALTNVIKHAEEQGLSIEEVDALTGNVIGRPKTATYGLIDLVGADIAYNVTKGMLAVEEEANYYDMPQTLEKAVDLGKLGNKVKEGFYKRVDRKTKLVLDVNSGEYNEPQDIDIPILNDFSKNTAKNLEVIFNADDKYGKFLWDTLADLFYYSAISVPKATEDYINVDRAMVWGYNWRLGPFQMWDAIGFEAVRDRLAETHGDLPEWINNLQDGFYKPEDTLSQAKPVSDLTHETIWNKENVGELNLADNGILVYTLRTPNNSLTNDFFVNYAEAVDLLEKTPEYRGMVLYSEGKNFSVGANLLDVAKAIKEGRQETDIADMVDNLHTAVLKMKHSSKPIVTAAKGQALGGGAELLLYSPFVVASSELYMGLVEIGVGLVPSGGGLAEVAERIYLKGYDRPQEIKALSKAFMNLATAKVSKNAYKAREMGYLRPTDTIINNDELLVEAAIKKADFEATYNYIPTAPQSYELAGTNFFAVAHASADSLVSGQFASEYDGIIAKEIANVVAGGQVPIGALGNQKYLMSLEKAAFVKLSQNEKTLDRIEHMLTKKRPLRN